MNGNLIVSAISIRDRLVKNCIAYGIKKIIIIGAAGEDKKTYQEYANEKTSTVTHINSLEQFDMDDKEPIIFIEDGFLLHSNLLEEFIASQAVTMVNPKNGKNIFLKKGIYQQGNTTSPNDEKFEPDPFYIFEVQDDNLKEARSNLFKWLGKESDGFISKTLNRPVSTFFSRFFADFPIQPVYFTAVTALIAALMAYVLFFGGNERIVWGCILFHIASVADGIDGEIARAKFLSSLSGAKIDTTIDMITNILFMAGLSFSLWDIYGDSYLILGVYIVLLALMGVIMMTGLLYFGPGGGRFDVLSDTIRLRFKDRPDLMKIFNFCNYFLKRDAFAFIFAVFGLLGLGKNIPDLLIFGLIVWNIAIILNARAIVKTPQISSKI